jgi:hypothetical protein
VTDSVDEEGRVPALTSVVLVQMEIDSFVQDENSNAIFSDDGLMCAHDMQCDKRKFSLTC